MFEHKKSEMKDRKKFMLGCLSKHNPEFKEYFDKLEENNKKFELKMNDKINKLSEKMNKEFKKETKGLNNDDKRREDIFSKHLVNYQDKFIKIGKEKLEYGFKSNQKLIKSKVYKSALQKTNRNCHKQIVNYEKILEKNLNTIKILLEIYKKEKNPKTVNKEIENYYTILVKMIDLLELELKMIKSVIEK